MIKNFGNVTKTFLFSDYEVSITLKLIRFIVHKINIVNIIINSKHTFQINIYDTLWVCYWRDIPYVCFSVQQLHNQGNINFKVYNSLTQLTFKLGVVFDVIRQLLLTWIIEIPFRVSQDGSERTMKIGDNNQFEVRCCSSALTVGNNNLLQMTGKCYIYYWAINRYIQILGVVLSLCMHWFHTFSQIGSRCKAWKWMRCWSWYGIRK